MCSAANSNLLGSVQIAATTVILGCLRTTSHDNILNDLDLTPLLLFRQFHTPTAFRYTLSESCSSFPSAVLPKFLKNLSKYSYFCNLNDSFAPRQNQFIFS